MLASRRAAIVLYRYRRRGNAHTELLPAAQAAIIELHLRPQRVAATGGADVKHRVGQVGWRDIDLVAAGLRHAIDHELAAGNRTLGIPQLELLITDMAGI